VSGHLNQPDGPFHPSGHPAVAGRERELRALADAGRQVVELVVSTVADPATTTRLAEEVEAVAVLLEAHLADPLYSRYGGGGGHPHDVFPFDPVLGLYNPLALPVELAWEAPLAVGVARFGRAYEGPPGCVHGAVIAGVFDQVCNVANIMSGVPGPTRTLEVRYRRPTVLDAECRFEAWIESVEHREVTTHGRLLQNGEETCRAAGVFVALTGGTPPG
jgi:hypothetical protein